MLVSDGEIGDTRDCVVAIRAIAAAGYRVAVTVDRHSFFAAPSRYVERRVLMPGVSEGSFAEALRYEVASESYCAFIPAAETVVLALGASSPDLLDKSRLSTLAKEAGLTVPEERVVETTGELLSLAHDLTYPVVVKPAVRTFKAFVADRPSDILEQSLPAGAVLLQPFLSGNMGAVAGVMWDGVVHTASHEKWERIWPTRCGLASAAVTVAPNHQYEAALTRLMVGYDGLFCAQFVDGHLIDLNLRVHSSLPLAMAAGANLVAVYCDLVRGVDVPPRRAVSGHRFRWLSGDVKGVMRSVGERSMTLREGGEALWPRRGTVHSLISIRDPLPLLARAARYVTATRGDGRTR